MCSSDLLHAVGDSRSSHVGAVPRNMILGKVEAVLWHQIPSTLDDWGLAND